MNRKVIKLFCLLIIQAMFLSIFSSCTYHIPVKDEATLTFYLFTWGAEKPDAKKVLAEVEEKAKKDLNIKLDFRWMSYDEVNKGVPEALSSDSDMDAFIYRFSADPMSYNFMPMAKSGELKDLTKVFPKYAPKLYKKYSKEVLDAVTVDGKLLAVPNLFPTAAMNYVTVREDLMKKYHLPQIQTLDDYQTYLKTVKENELGITPGLIFCTPEFVCSSMGGYDIIDSMLRLVYKRDDPDMKIMPLERTPAFNDYLKFMTDWSKNGYLYRSNDFIYQDVILQGMLSGKISSCMSLEVNAQMLTSMAPDSSYEFKDYYLYPDNKVQRSDPLEYSIAFNAKNNDVERALMFLEWINSSEENYDLFLHGINGEHYVQDGNGIKLPDGITLSTSRYLGWDSHEAFRNVEYERYDTAQSGGKEAYQKMIEDNSEPALSLGFYQDYSGFQEEAAALYNSFIMDIESKIFSGDFTMESIQEGIDNRKSLGVDGVVEKLQGQLDDWRKAK